MAGARPGRTCPLGAAGALLLAATITTLAVGCGPTSRQRQAMLMASEQAAPVAPGTTGGAASASVAPGTVGPRSAGGGPGGNVQVEIDEATYRVAPGDVLDVRFPFHPEENQRAPVRSDGRFSLGVAGDIDAAGHTIGELQAIIIEKSSLRLRGPVVNVVVAELADHRVFVSGQVARPGFVVFRPGLTSLQAIVERGGFLDDAKMDQIVHLHRRGRETVTRKLDLEAAFDGTAADQNILAPNDIVIVPRTFIGDADVFVDQWIRGLLPSIPQPGIDLPLLFF